MSGKKSATDLPRRRTCSQAARENSIPLFRGNTEESGRESTGQETTGRETSGEIIVDRTPHNFQVAMLREGKHWRTLGLIVSADDSSGCLIVEDIWCPSLISEWNESRVTDDATVDVGNIITSINGVSNDSKAMLAAIQSLGKGSQVVLQIERSGL